MKSRFADPLVWMNGLGPDPATICPDDPDSTERDAPDEGRRKTRYRTIWISDVHLGMPETRVHMLHDFLKHTDSEQLYLVGDIIDLWKLRHGWHWPTINNSIVRRITKKAKQGTRVVYIPGNHDDLLRQYLGVKFGDITLQAHAYHMAADGKRYLVLHGDEFDTIVMHNRLLSMVGGEAYAVSLKVNRWFNTCRRRLGLPYWSLSSYLKQRVKNAMAFISNYERAVLHEARQCGVDGVICGHIHHAAMTEIDGIAYCNTGDWVESCTALVEHFDGRLELLEWSKRDLADVKQPVQEGVAHADRNRKRRLVAAG